MNTRQMQFNIPLSINQIIELVRQLPNKEKIKLTEILKKETKQQPVDDKILTHFASEKTLASDWLSSEEDNAWKNL